VEEFQLDGAFLAWEIVDVDGEHVELILPLQEGLDFVGVDLLTKWNGCLPLFRIFMAL
jgi:hypothetical protein